MCRVDLPPVIFKAHYSPQEVGQVNPWWRSEFGIPEIARADGLIIAVIDTGADEAHCTTGDLKGVYLKHRDFSNSGNAWDHFGHGTHVGGMIGALNNSIGILSLQGVRLLNGKALGDDGGGTDLAVAQAIRWAVDEGAWVINCSLGSSQRSQAIADAVAYAVANGVLVMAASGNDGRDGVSDPADLDGTIAVGAIDRQRKLANFSNRGAQVQCVGPGVDILSTYRNGGYAVLSGTSMATPWNSMVAGLVMVEAKRKIGVQEYSRLLAACCDDLGTQGRDKLYGHGVPVLSKMLAAVAPKPAPVPAPKPAPGPGGTVSIRTGTTGRVAIVDGQVGFFVPAS